LAHFSGITRTKSKILLRFRPGTGAEIARKRVPERNFAGIRQNPAGTAIDLTASNPFLMKNIQRQGAWMATGTHGFNI